jgi:DNA-binding XRE family transcriptional regulator
LGDSSQNQSEHNSRDIASGLVAGDLPAYGMNGRALVAWNLRRIRVQRGLSQERLAHDAEVDRSYVGGLERQEENPTVDVLDRLAKTLEVPVSELFKLPCKGAAPPKPLRSGRRSHRSRLGHR